MAKRTNAVNNEDYKLSKTHSQQIIELLINNGIGVNEIAEKLGRNRKFVYRVRKGKAQLSARDLGCLASDVGAVIGSDVFSRIAQISIGDVLEAAEEAAKASLQWFRDIKAEVIPKRKRVSEAARNACSKATSKSQEIAAEAVFRVQKGREAINQFIEGVSGKKQKNV